MQHADEADDGVDTRHQAIQRGRVEDVGLDQFDGGQWQKVAHAIAAAGWHDKGDPVTGQPAGNGRADETATADDEDFAG